MRHARRRDTGSATIVALGVIVLLLVTGAGAAAVAVGGYVHERAATSADAAALAGALAARREADGCRSARAVSVANGGSLSDCRFSGEDVEVTVVVEPPRWLSWAGSAQVKARAGPADAPGVGTNSDEPAPADHPS